MSYIYRYALGVFSSFVIAISLLLLNQALHAPIRTLEADDLEDNERFLCNFPTLQGKSFRIKTDIEPINRDSSRFLVSEQSNANVVLNAIYNATFRLTENATSKPPIIQFTSSNGQEGKSVLASNIAIGFAKTEAKTLLIDGHFESPELQNIFKIAFLKGFAWAIENKQDPRKIVVSSRYKNLSILPYGFGPNNYVPSITTLTKFLSVLKSSYDVILIDSGSIRHCPLAIIWARLATDIVMVAQRGKSPYSDFRDAMLRLKTFKNTTLWTCLNSVPMSPQSKVSNRPRRFFDQPEMF